MFRAETQKTSTKFTIRILKKNARQFAAFRKELEALLRKHGVKRATKRSAKRKK